MNTPITAQEMYGIEHAAMKSGSVTGLELMERAGAGCVAAILKRWPEFGQGARTAIILAGPGNNGGDGFVIARHLAVLGWDVRVYAQGWDALINGRSLQTEKPSDAQANAERWLRGGGTLVSLQAEQSGTMLGAEIAEAASPVVIVDALLGIGQSRACDAMLAPVHAALDLASDLSPNQKIYMVAVDIPTGLVTDSVDGQSCADAPLDPDLVVTFHRHKPVHVFLEKLGILVHVVDIGL